MRWSSLLAAAVLGAALPLAVAARGFAPDAVALLDSAAPIGALARHGADALGLVGALRLIFSLGGALSAVCLLWAGRGLPGRPGVALVALAAAPLVSGVLHAEPAALCLGPAMVALRAWRESPGQAVGWSAAVAAVSPVAGAALAVAGFVLRPGLLPLVLAALFASLGEAGAADVMGLPALRAWAAGELLPATAGVAVAVALVLVGGGLRMRVAGLAAAVLAAGPVIVVAAGDGQRLLPLPLPALPLAACGAEAGWMGAGVVAAAALGLAAAESSGARRFIGLGLVVAEGVLVGLRVPDPLPAAPPEAVHSLAERAGTVLHLPVTRSVHGEPARAALWHHQALLHGRPLYRDARGVGDDDPVLGEPGVVAVLGLLEPEEGWLIPQTEPGTALRALGITELVLDRAALSEADLARLDPVLARLYGPPQRDTAARWDLWRVEPVGASTLAPSPYLRKTGWPDTETWRTLDALLAAGRPAAPAAR